MWLIRHGCGDGVWFVKDGCGISCFIGAYVLLSFSNIVVVQLGSWPWGDFGQRFFPWLYQFWFAMSIWSHLAAMLSDPGAIPIDAGEELGDMAASCMPVTEQGGELKPCTKCRAPKPPSAHHCSVCKRCILKMDHHCPWINNCVGARNQKQFVLFLFYVQLQCWTAVVTLGARFLSLAAANPHHHQQRPKGFLEPDLRTAEEIRAEARRRAAERAAAATDAADGQALCCILIFFVAIIFGLFTAIMTCDQFSNILSNTTGIDAMQGHTPKARPWRESLQEVMGRGPSIRWLLPTPPRGQVQRKM